MNFKLMPCGLTKPVIVRKQKVYHFFKAFFSVLQQYCLYIISLLMILLFVLSEVSYIQYKKVVELEKKLLQQGKVTKVLRAAGATCTRDRGETTRLLKVVTEKYLFCGEKNSILVFV